MNSKTAISSQRSAVSHGVRIPVFSFLLIASCLLLFMACTKHDKMFKESRMLMDTYCTITVVSPSRERAKAAIDAGFAQIANLEFLLNYFTDDSEIAAINRAAGVKAVKVGAETLEILEKSVAMGKATGGAFDPTIAPVIKQWNFSKDSSKKSLVPSEEEIQEALRLVDYKKIEIDAKASEVFLTKKGMEIDLGGIAKGYGADRALNAIRNKGIRAALVAIAGDIRGYGLNLSGTGWKVGIQDPRPLTESDKPWEDIFAVLHLEESAISTSGDYQRFFIKDGRRYHHILDPETGFPAESGLVSVSVIAPEGYLADSLSTAVFVLGADKGMKLLELLGIDGVLVDADKNVMIGKNLKGKISVLNSDYQLIE